MSPGAGGALAAPASPGGGEVVTVAVHSGPLGAYLTDGTGRTVYLFTADSAGASHCSGQCADAWPPLTTGGSAAGASGASGAMVGTVTRADGAKQVTYAGHPLYYYAADTSAGDSAGEGIDGFGGLWWMVAPSGRSVTTAPAKPPAAPGTTARPAPAKPPAGGGWG